MQPNQTPRQPQQASDAPLTSEQPTAPPPPPPPPPEACNAVMADRNKSNYPDYQTLIPQTKVVEAQLDDEYLDMLSDGSQHQASASQPIIYQACANGALINYWLAANRSLKAYASTPSPSLRDGATYLRQFGYRSTH